ncbi:MAG: AMP-binding protein, partial [Planctomycetota bacterium]
RFPTLKRVISAGAPVPARVLRRWTGLIDAPAQIFTPYGATECLPVAILGSDTILGRTAAASDQGAGICVGPPVTGLDLRIIAIDDGAITDWEVARELPVGGIGEVCVRAAQATRSYFQRDDQTALAKIACDDGGFYHRMGDLGYRDADGHLWFCGRKSHRVRTTAGELYTIPVEGPCNTVDGVFRSALVGIGAPGAQRPVICIECDAERPRSEHPRIRDAVTSRVRELQLCTPVERVLIHPGFPVDIRHNAKIDRPALARWAGRMLGV